MMILIPISVFMSILISIFGDIDNEIDNYIVMVRMSVILVVAILH